jgi:hypothetical protein
MESILVRFHFFSLAREKSMLLNTDKRSWMLMRLYRISGLPALDFCLMQIIHRSGYYQNIRIKTGGKLLSLLNGKTPD